mmetsp:Transcript_19082/g.62853  ORF Transcript_19082/g.62853 Transcript_19082/m.62853 type:complete len:252 (+) Transcript_19082:4427-5182(+)
MLRLVRGRSAPPPCRPLLQRLPGPHHPLPPARRDDHGGGPGAQHEELGRPPLQQFPHERQPRPRLLQLHLLGGAGAGGMGVGFGGPVPVYQRPALLPEDHPAAMYPLLLRGCDGPVSPPADSQLLRPQDVCGSDRGEREAAGVRGLPPTSHQVDEVAAEAEQERAEPVGQGLLHGGHRVATGGGDVLPLLHHALPAGLRRHRGRAQARARAEAGVPPPVQVPQGAHVARGAGEKGGEHGQVVGGEGVLLAR